MARVALIGGTGAGLFPIAADAERLPGATRWGAASAPLLRWEAAGHELLFLARHGESGGIPPHRVNYRANIAALADLQPDWVIALNTVGAIASALQPGELVIPEQLIDYTWGRAHSYFDGTQDERLFIEFTSPYDLNLRTHLSSAAAVAGVPCTAGGVYGVTQGPRLETAAEIDRLERDGCSIVGMTAMPEAGLAREAGLAYASLALVVNAAAGRGSGSLHADIERHLAVAVDRAARVVAAALARF